MAQQYKRSICTMCTHREACDAQRWGAYCGACADSLKCAAREGISNPDCKKLRAAWLGLPNKCLLVDSCVNQKANTQVDPFIPATVGDTLVCPRCQQEMGSIYIDHGLNHLFKRVSKYIYSCDYCGVDETIEVR